MGRHYLNNICSHATTDHPHQASLQFASGSHTCGAAIISSTRRACAAPCSQQKLWFLTMKPSVLLLLQEREILQVLQPQLQDGEEQALPVFSLPCSREWTLELSVTLNVR